MKITLFLLLTSFLIPSFAQDNQVFKIEHKIASKAFDEERTITVYLPPNYLKEMKEKMQVDADGTVLIDLGNLPEDLVTDEYEVNLLLLNKKTVCHYTAFYNIKRYKWGLLDMGLYTDTLIYKDEKKDNTKDREKQTTSIQYRKLQFVIPFEKNKTNYSKEDILPLYDSLSLNLYDIKQIKIRAYSSVEGSKANNIRLQETRAKSIVEALQEYQSEQIKYDISSAENWVEFYQDIQESPYRSLSSLSKEAIKKKLSDKNFNQEMEPILGAHRKAVVEIQIEKKTTFKHLSEEQIVSEFQKSISNKDEATSIELMNLAFQRILNEESPSTLMNQLELPNQQAFGVLNNRKTVFEYYLNEADLETTYQSLLALKKQNPQSKEVNYNLVALTFKRWLAGKEIKKEAFKNEIRGLVRYDVSAKLINRMLINYNILLTEKNMLERNYKAKDRNLKAIQNRYKTIQAEPEDILKLAQYFAAYGKFEWATRIIKPYIGKVDTDEDLLFYFINLTVLDSDAVQDRTYKKILLNAIDINEERFCQLFNSAQKDGISFQLLDIPLLKKNYCESCN